MTGPLLGAVWIGEFGTQRRQPRPPVCGAGIRYNDGEHIIQAAISGQGISLLSLVLASDDLASGALIKPFGPVLDADPY